MTAFALMKETFKEWNEDNAPRLAASLAYYTLFSMAPLLVIAIAIAGAVLGEEAVRGEIVENTKHVLGESGAKGIEEMIKNANRTDGGVIATVVSILTLLFGASGAFGQLKDALNAIWEVPAKKSGGFLQTVKQRFLSFAMVLGVGFLLLVSLVVSAALSATGKFLSSNLPGGETLWQIVNLVIAFAVITVLFAMIFKYLPDVKVEWRDVWIGAAFTSLLFAIGKLGIGIYLGKGAVGSAFGAAGSVIVVLVWVYYSGLILFFGAEFTEVYARRRGSFKDAGLEDRKARTELVPPGASGATASRSHAHEELEQRRKGRQERVLEENEARSRPATSGGGVGIPLAAGSGGCLLGALLGVWGVVKAIGKVVKLPFKGR